MSDEEKLTDDLDLQGFNFDDLPDDEQNNEPADNSDANISGIDDIIGDEVNETKLEDLLNDDVPSMQNDQHKDEKIKHDNGDDEVLSGIIDDDFSEPTDADWNVLSGVNSQNQNMDEQINFEQDRPENNAPMGVKEPETTNMPELTHDEAFADDFAMTDDLAVDTTTKMSNNEDENLLHNEKASYLKWYSGSLPDKMFEIEKGFESGSFDADEERKTIHVNVGYDTYGWEVQFSDGVVMNLRDVREYQIRNGRLPSADGRIIYGQSILAFSGVERIVVYKSVKYFSYGI